ncbi:MAG: CehA/McbA family metallohydrolase [Limisphaerales bacterium]
MEYRIIQLYSNVKGKRDANLSFDVGQGTQDLGFRNETSILFDCLPAYTIKLNVLDENNKPTTAGFEIRDQFGRVYPSQAKRLAPDFHFHPQIYRSHNEKVKLPKGIFHIKFYRGPESITHNRTINVNSNRTESFKVKRWIDPSLMGWWSGDHHIHAAGCSHYTNPTEGVHAPDMMRHCLGEDLKVGANLTWGPCFDYQKQFFTGKDDFVSTFPYILRYDVEVSGFGSHQSGHLCLLRLRQQMFPGGESKHHWPKLCLNTLKWAKKQGAIVGPAHTGWGLNLTSSNLPTYEVPPFNSIGANEFIADVTHNVTGPNGKQVPAVDFLSMVDTPYVWELNIWYHVLNCGFRTRISGETDFPCIYGERVGLGRSYVKLDNKLNYNDWCEGIRLGRNYVGDGRSHIIDFHVDDVEMGTNKSELLLDKPGTVLAKAKVAALLKTKPISNIAKRHYSEKPYWHIERARIENSRKVPIEVIVNGYPISQQEITANGELQDIAFEVPIHYSSWIALRILPSSHTNPVFVIVDNKPIRASKRSAQWCLEGVEKMQKRKTSLYGQR